jgi:hypothetical protein
VSQERRGLRFPFSAAAEVSPETSPGASVAVRATELSLQGCYLEMPSPFAAEAPVFVKIFHAGEYFEAKGTVLYAKTSSGMGLKFREVKPHCRAILQKWILAALHNLPDA